MARDLNLQSSLESACSYILFLFSFFSVFQYGGFEFLFLCMFRTLSFSNATDQDVISRASQNIADSSLDSGSFSNNELLEKLKQEILAEVRKDLTKMKLEIIDGKYCNE